MSLRARDFSVSADGPKLETAHGSELMERRMMCRACQEQESAGSPRGSGEERGGQQRSAAPIIPIRNGEARVRDQLCSRCGHLLGPEDTAVRVRAKQSQLARFGLGKARKPLLGKKGRRPRREDQ